MIQNHINNVKTDHKEGVIRQGDSDPPNYNDPRYYLVCDEDLGDGTVRYATKSKKGTETVGTSGMNQRYLQLDVMRVLALFIIVILVHLPFFIKYILSNASDLVSVVRSPLIVDIGQYLAFFGLSIFVFLSGYVNTMRYPELNSFHTMRVYLQKRVLKIYPQFWVALLLSYVFFTCIGVVYHVEFGYIDIVINSLGANVLLNSNTFIPFWFVGFILLAYITYILITYRHKNIEDLLIRATFIFLIFVALNVFFGMISNELFIYYWIFIAGVVAHITGFFHIHNILTKSTVICAALLCIIVSLFTKPDFQNILRYNDPILASQSAFSIVYLAVFGTLICILTFWLSNCLVENLLSKYDSILKDNLFLGKGANFASLKLDQRIVKLSNHSYTIYLFHILVFSILSEILKSVNIPSIYKVGILTIGGIILVYYMSAVIDRWLTFCIKLSSLHKPPAHDGICQVDQPGK